MSRSSGGAVQEKHITATQTDNALSNFPFFVFSTESGRCHRCPKQEVQHQRWLFCHGDCSARIPSFFVDLWSCCRRHHHLLCGHTQYEGYEDNYLFVFFLMTLRFTLSPSSAGQDANTPYHSVKFAKTLPSSRIRRCELPDINHLQKLQKNVSKERSSPMFLVVFSNGRNTHVAMVGATVAGK